MRAHSEAARDRGDANSLVIVLLAPMLVVLLFAGWQAALWSHARAELRAVARDTAGLVARSQIEADDAASAARVAIEGGIDVDDVAVDVAVADGVVTVALSGTAPGIIRGTGAAVSVTVALPVEEWSEL